MLEEALGTRARRGNKPTPRTSGRRGQVIAQNASLVVAVTLLVAMLVIYIVLYMGSLSAFPGSFEAASITDHAVPLSLAAVGQSLVAPHPRDRPVGRRDDGHDEFARGAEAQRGPRDRGALDGDHPAVGAAGGLLNGVLVAYGRIQPILVTIGTLSIFQGIALWVLPTPGGHVANGYTSLFLNPNAPTALIYVVLLALGWVAFRRTRLGVHIFAVGNDEAAARANSVRVARTKVIAYVLSGTLAAAAGIALATTTTGGDSTGGDVFTLSSIAAAVVGGVSLFGGRGSAVGAICGAFVLTLLVDVLFFANIDPLFQPFYQGLFLVVAVGATTLLGRVLVRRR